MPETANSGHRPLRVLELRSVCGTGGGPEKTILLGTARTDPSRYAITVCYLRDLRDDLFHIDSRAGQLNIDYVEVHERHSLDTRIWPALRSVVRDRQIDIVHAHDYKTDLLALLLARAESAIPMATAHGWAGHGWKERRVYYPADRLLLTRFPRVVAVSSEIRAALLRAGARPERVEVVPNGVDHLQFQRDARLEQRARRTLGIDTDDVAVGAIGRLESEKNYPLLLRSVSQLSAELPRLHVFVAGEGSQRATLEALARDLGLANRCTFLGQTADISLFHHALDLFVMCSDNEGSPNAVLEAMAMETPVVATDVGGVSDMVGHGNEGLLVPRGDGPALTNAIRNALVDRQSARRRAIAARRKVELELSFDRRMKRVEAIYDSLVQSNPQATGPTKRRPDA